MVQQFQILSSASSPVPFQNPCCVPVLECLSLVMSVSVREEREHANRIASNNRLVKHKARVQRQKDEFKARLRAEERERQFQKSAKDKRDSCLLCLSSWHGR